jgi:hypothetical protein
MLRLMIGCVVGLATALTVGWVGGQALVDARLFSGNRPLSVVVPPPAPLPAPLIDIPSVPSPAGVPDDPPLGTSIEPRAKTTAAATPSKKREAPRKRRPARRDDEE